LLGPFDGVEGDPLASLGGAEKARLSPGIKVEFHGSSMKCVPLPESAIVANAAFAAKPFKIVLPALTPGARSYLYSLLKIDRETGASVDVSFPFDFQEATLWINGTKVVNGADAILKPGMHRLLIEVKGPVVSPTFRDSDAYLHMGHYQRYVRQLKKYAIAKKRYEETGERQDIPIKLGHARNAMVSWWRNSIGDHGWGTESGYWHAHGELMPFTIAYENATGERVVPGTGIPWMAPLGMAMTTASGAPQFSSVKGAPLGMIIHVIDPKVQPALLLPFEKDRLSQTLAHRGCKELVFLFANYPLDAQAKPASEIMPLALADERKGGYVFRSSYDKGGPPTGGRIGHMAYAEPSSLDKGLDDILAAIFLRSRPSGGGYFFCESGTFRIVGLGTPWAMGLPGNKRNWQYAEECVVLAPPSNGAGLGRKIYSELKPDGSGVVGADMSDVYRDHPSKINAARHFAVDYSGDSGAPALIAIVDRVHGGEAKTWVMHSGGASTSVSGNDFTIAGQQPGTSLAGRLMADDGVKLATGPVVWHQSNPEFKKEKQKPKPKIVGGEVETNFNTAEFVDVPWGSDTTLKADTKAENADFFFVMTIQKGSPPKFEIEGRGLDAKVKVGKRIVRFDQQRDRLVLE
jgi:hypothetical protein